MRKKGKSIFTPLRNELASAIKQHLKDNDLKVYDLARKMDVRETYLYQCLQQDSSTSLEKLLEIMIAAEMKYTIDISKI